MTNYIAPDAIRDARKDAGLTQRDAAALVSSTARAWGAWEAGFRAMPPAKFALFMMLTCAPNAPVIDEIERAQLNHEDQLNH